MATIIDKQFAPSEQRKRRALLFSAISLAMIGISVVIDFNPLVFITEFHNLAALFRDMTPPRVGFLVRNPQIFESTLSTLAMAALGTIVGGGISLLLAFLAARNITPHPILGALIKILFAIERVIPSFIILLVFIIFVGIGPFAGMLALAVSTIGTFGKIFTESIEQVNQNIVESLRSTGATRLQVIRFGVIPQVLSAFTANFFFAFDVNVRTAIGLGIFGGGGLGFEMDKAMKLMEYRSALALILVIVALVFLVEKFTEFLRKRLVDVSR